LTTRFLLCYDGGMATMMGSERETKKTRVVVAMSGGVDSSTAAMLLVEAGYDVVGLMIRMWSEPTPDGRPNRCCSPQSVDDARRVARLLGIPFYLVDYEDEFKAAVVDYFVAEYARGRTPNPCLECNRQIRFGLLLQRAFDLGAEYLATGHYARIVVDGERYRLLKGVDTRKDQSYVLHVLGQEQLAHVLFPLGELTKPEVRDLARAHGLPVAEKAESQDICFLSGTDYRPFIEARASSGLEPGPIFDEVGRLVGEHAGLARYTVGQRHGLGLATGMPVYVTAIDARRNALIVGPAESLLRREVTVSNVNYISGTLPEGAFSCQVRLRYRAREAQALVTPLPERRALITFAEAQKPVSPGQAAVFYQGDEVIGGGLIE